MMMHDKPLGKFQQGSLDSVVVNLFAAWLGMTIG
jgi:hypothetical protein